MKKMKKTKKNKHGTQCAVCSVNENIKNSNKDTPFYTVIAWM